MKIDIKNRVETKGIFRKTSYHFVELTVVLTEEEKQLIKQHKMEDTIIMDRPPPATIGGDADWPLKFSTLVYGRDTYNCTDPAEAAYYQQQLLERLKEAKAYLDRMNIRNEDTSMEL